MERKARIALRRQYTGSVLSKTTGPLLAVHPLHATYGGHEFGFGLDDATDD